MLTIWTERPRHAAMRGILCVLDSREELLYRIPVWRSTGFHQTAEVYDASEPGESFRLGEKPVPFSVHDLREFRRLLTGRKFDERVEVLPPQAQEPPQEQPAEGDGGTF